MPNILTDWRAAVAAHLKTMFPTYTVYSGYREGRSSDMDVIAVFSPGIREMADRVHTAEHRLFVRIWPRLISPVPGEEPRDPEQLEQLAVDLETALRAVQKTLATSSGIWFTRLTNVEMDYDDWGCQATLVAWSKNPAVIA